MYWIITLLMISALAEVGLVWSYWCGYRTAHSLADARAALRICGQLLKLVSHMQQHRGMCSALLGGEESFRSRVLDKRGEIDNIFTVLAHASCAEGTRLHPGFTEKELSLLRMKWQSLIGRMGDLSIEQSVAHHGHIIAITLGWAAGFGEARIILATESMLPAGRTRNFCQRLPALSECLGQARAIGLSVAARGHCAPVARVRLIFLMSRAESLLRQAIAEDGVNAAGSMARGAVEELILTTRRNMLAVNGVAVSVDAYFDLATRAIDAVFAWAHFCGASIEAVLEPDGGSAIHAFPTLRPGNAYS